MKVAIITDSASDLTLAQAKELGVEIVPMVITFEQKSYIDVVELSKEDFFRMQAQSEQLPVTSQPNPDDFLKVFQKHKEEGNAIIYIGISSVLSGTFQSALIAKDMLDYSQIYLIDSLSAAFGVEALIQLAISMREQGIDASEIAKVLEQKKEKLKILAAVDTLKYLIKGGRVSKAAGAIGGVLNLKPIITLKDGSIVSIAKTRGQTGAFDYIAKAVKEAQIDETLPIILTHSNDAQAMSNFVSHLRNDGINYQWTYAQVGSTIGTHTGPGCVGICYFEK